MHRRLGVVLAVVAFVLGGLATTARVQAQEATPVALPITPGEELCTVEPRPVEELEELLGTTTGTPSTDEGEEDEPTLVTLPTGEPADEATTAAITATVVEVFACFNAGDYPRALALYGDELVRSFGPIAEEGLAFFVATPEAIPEDEQGSVVEVRDVLVQEGDRATAVVVTNEPGAGGEVTSLAFFVLQDDRYIVEEVVENAEIRERSPATPIP